VPLENLKSVNKPTSEYRALSLENYYNLENKPIIIHINVGESLGSLNVTGLKVVRFDRAWLGDGPPTILSIFNG
jgi:hypothetical protein